VLEENQGRVGLPAVERAVKKVMKNWSIMMRP
jgi:hypothetical protein